MRLLMPALILGCLLPPGLAQSAAVRTALGVTAEEVATRVTALGTSNESLVGIFVESPESGELARAVQTLVIAALAEGGFRSAAPVQAASAELAEKEARRLGLDSLLRLSARIDGAELVLAGDLVPVWMNFWLGASGARAPGGGVVLARARLDAEALALAGIDRTRPVKTDPAQVVAALRLRQLARIPGRVVALAAVEPDGEGRPRIALLTGEAVLLLSPDGRILASRAHAGIPRAGRPSREPAGTLAFGDWTGDGRPRLAWHSFGRQMAEVLEGPELVPHALLDSSPVSAGAAGAVRGRHRPGTNLLAPGLELGVHKVTLPFAPVVLAASPRVSPYAFLAVGPDGAGRLLGPELVPVGPELQGLGAASALGDFDGDGEVELLSTALTRGEDRIRLLKIEPGGMRQIFEGAPVAHPLMAAAAVSTGRDGRDEAVLAGWTADGDSVLWILEAGR